MLSSGGQSDLEFLHYAYRSNFHRMFSPQREVTDCWGAPGLAGSHPPTVKMQFLYSLLATDGRGPWDGDE